MKTSLEAEPRHQPAPPARRVGVVGCGRIARPIISALEAGELPAWLLGAVLARTARTLGRIRVTGDIDAFLGAGHDLIIEAAGPAVLATHGVRLLEHADVWSVSAAALADPALQAALEATGQRTGHRLRLVPGAIAGLDGVAMAALDPDVRLDLAIDLLPGPGPAGDVLDATVRTAARHHPDHVNVAMAAALAGPGPDRARIVLRHPGPVERHRLGLTATSRYGIVRVSVEPIVAPGVHPVAASLIAALRQATRVIWVG